MGSLLLTNLFKKIEQIYIYKECHWLIYEKFTTKLNTSSLSDYIQKCLSIFFPCVFKYRINFLLCILFHWNKVSEIHILEYYYVILFCYAVYNISCFGIVRYNMSLRVFMLLKNCIDMHVQYVNHYVYQSGSIEV